jgi:hypothetical protein
VTVIATPAPVAAVSGEVQTILDAIEAARREGAAITSERIKRDPEVATLVAAGRVVLSNDSLQVDVVSTGDFAATEADLVRAQANVERRSSATLIIQASVPLSHLEALRTYSSIASIRVPSYGVIAR